MTPLDTGWESTGQVPDLAELANRMAIYEVLVTHCRGVDRADEALLKVCYWPESTVAYGAFNGNAHEFCGNLPMGIRRYAGTQHTLTNFATRIAGSGAAVETYVTAYHYLAGDDEPDTEMTYLGRYLDEFEKRGEVWRIKHRQVTMDWNQNTNATAILDGPPFDGLARGARAPEDPSYALMEKF